MRVERYVTVSEARLSWNRLIKEVLDSGASVIITRYGPRVAVLAGVDQASALFNLRPEAADNDLAVR